MRIKGDDPISIRTDCYRKLLHCFAHSATAKIHRFSYPLCGQPSVFWSRAYEAMQRDVVNDYFALVYQNILNSVQGDWT